MLEPLEPRQHLSTTLTRGVLTVTGTHNADAIAIAAGKRTFVVHDNGEQTSFATDRVKLVRIHGLRGNDSIIVSPRFTIRCSIEGGGGNDRIGGGARDDTIFGQAGNDTLVGNGGTDYLDAGPDDDLLVDTQDAAPDVLHGGSGIDSGRFTYPKYGSGVENQDYHGGNGQVGIKSEIYTRNGRTYLRLSEPVTPDTEISVVGPAQLEDGSYFVRTRVMRGTLTAYGEIRASTFDITEANGATLYYNQMVGTDDDPFNFMLLRLA